MTTVEVDVEVSVEVSVEVDMGASARAEPNTPWKPATRSTTQRTSGRESARASREESSVVRRIVTRGREYRDFTLEGMTELVTTGKVIEDGRGEGRRTTLFFSVLFPILSMLLLCLYAFAFSTGWLLCSIVVNGILNSGLNRMRLGKKRDVLPSFLARYIGCLWFIAALLQVCVSAIKMSRAAGWVSDFACDLVFASLAVVLLATLQWLECTSCHRTQGKLTEAELKAMLESTTCTEALVPCSDRDSCGKALKKCSVRCSCWVGFFCFGGPSAVVAVLSCFHSCSTLALLGTSPPTATACHPDGRLCLSYQCEGEVRNGAIAIVVNGFAATSDAYFFIGSGLRGFTRTCTYDPRGIGWSQNPRRHFLGQVPDFGFEQDASDLRVVLEREFTIAGVAPSARVAVLAGHSRGRLVAIKFRAEYREQYRQVVVIGLDGVQTCGPITTSVEDDLRQLTYGVTLPEGFVRYVAAPLMPFAAGFVDLAMGWAPDDSRKAFFAGQPIGHLPYEIVTLLPRKQQQALQSQLTMERFWLTNAVVRGQWETRYDGPTPVQCLNATSAEGAYLSIRAASTCLEEGADGHCCQPHRPHRPHRPPPSAPMQQLPLPPGARLAVPVPSPPSPQSPSTAASPSSWPPPSLPQSRPAPPLEPPAPPPSPQVPPLSPPPGPPNAFNCGRVATRARLDGAACYQLDSSHSIIAAAYLDCEQYYMSVPQHPGAVKLCYWDGAGQCRPSARFACLNVPPATPSPPQPPPPGPPTAPPPLTNCGRVATRINLTPSGAAWSVRRRAHTHKSNPAWARLWHCPS